MSSKTLIAYFSRNGDNYVGGNIVNELPRSKLTGYRLLR